MMLQTRSASLKRALCSRHIRAHLGDRLRAYYLAMQQVPLPDRLADRIKQLAQLIDEENRGPASATRLQTAADAD